MKIERKPKTYRQYRYKEFSVKVDVDIYEATNEDAGILIKVEGINKVVLKSELKEI